MQLLWSYLGSREAVLDLHVEVKRCGLLELHVEMERLHVEVKRLHVEVKWCGQLDLT